jgi:hypothetical protein
MEVQDLGCFSPIWGLWLQFWSNRTKRVSYTIMDSRSKPLLLLTPLACYSRFFRLVHRCEFATERPVLAHTPPEAELGLRRGPIEILSFYVQKPCGSCVLGRK